MPLLKIIHHPDKRLRKIAKPVTKTNKKITKITNNMFETMYFHSGIGLAATQVNIQKQIIVIDISHNQTQKIVLINPKILTKNGEISMQEGCLSIPNKYGLVTRAKEIKICALNKYGKYFEIKTNNLLSICIQHEIDHLVGKLFIDYL
ncbi:Peptide deformylase [Candidatus Westeberhardia cardiocondylae]|uniref:Peptide deformylase n=1 Tax=Candidatus Westeberhardia cardiocondylae TaxID=1594731 RepID=A0A0H5BWF6_9ENTR|nr:peptide deformylase [Candidatus Westeberhardia cardiocondylae]MCR3756396.1 peptide deformylase [Candidatus Westeberhardia cardiocondylae]CEN32005.1 Peptide deformylase [Candidatus Westeberhardia cardiocondylae]